MKLETNRKQGKKMRPFTYYELKVLVKNEVQNMQMNCIEGFSINYIKQRAKDILEYIEEMEVIEKNEEI
jgi:hypothetical protein